MLPRFRFTRLLWFVLLICAFSVFGHGYAEAEEGLASWYGPGLAGKPTASGAPYDPNGFTAASRTLPLGTKLLVSYGERTVPVTVNDRGPFVAGLDLDLSQRAAQALGLTDVGVGDVDWRLADPNLPQGGVASQQPDLTQGTAQPLGLTKIGVSYMEDWRFAEPDLLQQGASQGLGVPQGVAQQPDLARGSTQPPGFTKVGVGEVEDWRFANPNFPQQGVSQEPGAPQGAVPRPDLLHQTAQQPAISQGGAAPQPDSLQGPVQDQAGGGVYLVQPGDTLSEIAPRLGVSVDQLAKSNGIADPNVIYSGQTLRLSPDGIDPNFIRGQEGFRLDAYVPDPGLSRSGVTVGTGVDIGQMNVADIESLDIPKELKQKLEPYAGLRGQDAVNFLNNRPLYLTEDEARALDRVVASNTVEGVANRFDTAALGSSFTELPLEVRTAIADVAYQYGPDLAQRMPDFWSDVTAGRWNTVVQKLRNFGDRYPTRRNAEADLLERAIERGDFRDYVVQPGDTLSDVASRLGTSAEYLAARNGLNDPNSIFSGQTLYY